MNIPYIRSGDYFIPDLKLPEETRPIGKWGRMHRDYLKEHHPLQFNALILSGNLWTYLADLNEQAQQRMETHYPTENRRGHHRSTESRRSYWLDSAYEQHFCQSRRNRKS